jgi:hypothetical protein
MQGLRCAPGRAPLQKVQYKTKFEIKKRDA